jgi:hypothetical protein
MTDRCTAQERLSQVADHMSSGSRSSSSASKKGRASLLEKNPDDVSTPGRSFLTIRMRHSEGQWNFLKVLELSRIITNHLKHCTNYFPGRRNMRAPHAIHQGRKRWLQRHASFRPSPRRLQSPPRALRNRPQPRRRHCRRRSPRSRRWCYRVPCRCPRCRFSRHDCS